MAVIQDLCYQHILGTYYYAHYGTGRVVMERDSGFMNASAFCRQAGKQLRHWLRTTTAKAQIARLQEAFSSTDPPRDAMWVYSGSEGQQDPVLGGTYLHPELMVPLAMWVSIDFAVDVAQRMTRDLIDDAVPAHAEAERTETTRRLTRRTAALAPQRRTESQLIRRWARETAQDLRTTLAAKRSQVARMSAEFMELQDHLAVMDDEYEALEGVLALI